jgi:predicted HTH transcriptional regulator
VDRVTTDGAWSDNLFNFYQIVIQKLYRDLKVPFKLEGPSRVDDTPVHEALREALTNTLVHADYSGTVPIQIIKRPDMFSFRNPGTMRVPVDDAIRGGLSDCRNRNLQTMFDLIGYGERAGSGLPKIFQNWKEQLWRLPELEETFKPEQTILVMRMMSLLPDAVIKRLESRFGDDFKGLTNEQKLALATVDIEGKVTHARIKEMSEIHPHDLSKALKDLVTRGYLESAGATRATVYTFPRVSSLLKSEYTIHIGSGIKQESEDGSSVHIPSSSVHSEGSSVHNGESSVHSELRELVNQKLGGKKRVSPELMEETIRLLCIDRSLTLEQLEELLERSSETIRTHYLNPMVKRGILKLKYPDKPTHPDQGYQA